MCLLLFIASLFSIKSAQSPEQIAFDYFVSEILRQNYSEEKNIYFCGQTEAAENMAGPFSECFESDNGFRQLFYEHNGRFTEQIAIDFSNFQNVKKSIKPKAHKLNLTIFRAVNKGEFFYVHLKVYEEKDVYRPLPNKNFLKERESRRNL